MPNPQSPTPNLHFTPSPDVAAMLHALLDVYERRDDPGRRPIRCRLEEISLPGYHSQVDPDPRYVANEQLGQMEERGLVKLAWQPGQTGHLLDSVTLVAERADAIYTLVGREPLATRRAALRDLLLADRFRFQDWRRAAVDHALAQLGAGKSPAPFSLTDPDFGRDLLTALIALDEVTEETPYRIFSVHVFNDSKVFETLSRAIVRLARRHQPAWRDLSPQETLRELGLVSNPSHLYLYGPWRLVDTEGQVTSLAGFYPSVGIPANLAACLRQVMVDAARVVCVENVAAFYELIRHESEGLAALCLAGNPSPACRHLLRCLAEGLPADVPLHAWADIDYGGLTILAMLRSGVSRRFAPYRMDVTTLEAHARWAQPLTSRDEKNLARLERHPHLTDVQPLIAHMLQRGLKLEQEAILLSPPSAST
jgi:hypothetical protein